MSSTAIWKQIELLYENFTAENVYEREFLVWQNKLTEVSNKEHFEYIKDWFEKRMTYLDDYVKSL